MPGFRPRNLLRGLFLFSARANHAPMNQAVCQTVRLDLRGYRCPIPVIRLEAALRSLTPGAKIIAIADDPVAAIDIPHYCRQAGHEVLRMLDDGDSCVFQVTRAAKPA